MAERETQLVLGAGKLFFDRFDANGDPTGELYIGNTTSLTYSTDEERQEHFSSDTAERERDASIVIRTTATLGFTTDDIIAENLAMLFKGDAEALAIAAAPAQTENITITTLGRWYQIGATDANPTGTRLISNVVVSDNVPAVIPDLPANYEVDLVRARIYVPEGGAIAAGDVITIAYDQAASSRTVIISKGDQIKGSVRYVADNTKGENIDHYWPLVEISPDGDYEFKGDDWNEMSFSGEVLTKTTAAGVKLERHYADGQPVAA